MSDEKLYLYHEPRLVYMLIYTKHKPSGAAGADPGAVAGNSLSIFLFFIFYFYDEPFDISGLCHIKSYCCTDSINCLWRIKNSTVIVS